MPLNTDAIGKTYPVTTYAVGRENYLRGIQNLQVPSAGLASGSAVFENPGTSIKVQLVNNDNVSKSFYYDVYGRRN